MKYVIYHKNCNDGTAAATAAWLALGSTAKYIPMMYGDPIPDMPDCEFLYIVDFSLPVDKLAEFNKKLNGNLRVLDHHKTAEESLKGLPYCTFDMKKCGSMLTWEYFHKNEPVPRFFHYIQDYDIWTKKLPYTDEATAYINSFHRTLQDFNAHIKTFEIDFDGVVTQGRAMLRYHNMDVEKVCQSARKHKWNGEIDCLVVNTPAFFASDVGGLLAERNPDAKFICCYSDTHDGKRYYSLRSKGEFDVSAVAKTFPGGGGHKNASGFLIDKPVQLFF
jgi:oligoribonuclease NrnB/cAMP/cGMP phosphodiesterase (DHH superfamily)